MLAQIIWARIISIFRQPLWGRLKKKSGQLYFPASCDNSWNTTHVHQSLPAAAAAGTAEKSPPAIILLL